MNKVNINICLLKNAVGQPHYASKDAAGIDISAGISANLLIRKNTYNLIPSGFQIEIPEGFEGQVRPRSGLAFKNGLTVLNSPGTIDSDYRGEVKVLIVNLGKDDFIVYPGMRIAQLIISPVFKANLQFVDKLETKSHRGDKGFGSTGIKAK